MPAFGYLNSPELYGESDHWSRRAMLKNVSNKQLPSGTSLVANWEETVRIFTLVCFIAHNINFSVVMAQLSTFDVYRADIASLMTTCSCPVLEKTCYSEFQEGCVVM